MSGLIEHVYPQINQKVYTKTFPSGFKLTIIPKDKFREQSALISINYGGVDTRFTVGVNPIEHPNGLAHFLEHQVFENEGKEDFAQEFTKLGADSNAFTSFTVTNYYFSTVDYFPEALTTLLTMVEKVRFTELSMTKEKGIVKQEIDMYQDDPDYRLYLGVLSSLFPDTPIAVDLAGTSETLEQISHQQLVESFSTFYRPEQMHLVVVGDLDEEQIVSLLEQHRLVSECDSQLSVDRAPIDYLPVKTRQSIRMDVVKPKLAVAFRPKTIIDHDLLYLKLVLKLYTSMVLGWTASTYQDWYEQSKIDDSFDIQIEINERFQFIVISLDTDEPIGMSAKIKSTLKNPSNKQDLSQEHFSLLKKEYYGEFISSMDQLDELTVLYLEHQLFSNSYFDLPDFLSTLTWEEVYQTGQSFFKAADATDFTIFPK